MIGLRPMCDACTHVFDGEGWRCEAFPNGIPARIYEGGADHRKPVKGDHGILFSQKPEERAFNFFGVGGSLILSESVI
jgi:hypothetical protein